MAPTLAVFELTVSFQNTRLVAPRAATIEALKQLKRAEDVAKLRGKTVDEMVPWMKRVEEAAVAAGGPTNG